MNSTLFEIVGDVITGEESEYLGNFIMSKFKDVPAPSGSISLAVPLPYRLDEWDDRGIIEKIHSKAKHYFQTTFNIGPNIGPMEFLLVKSEMKQRHKTFYEPFVPGGDVFYTAIITPVVRENHDPGTTNYINLNQSLSPGGVDMVVHKNDVPTNWEIVGGNYGIRVDLIIVFRENTKRISYDYKIDQTDSDSLIF